MCIILVANIIRRSGHAIHSSFLSARFHLSPPQSSQFSKSQPCNMIVLAARLKRTPFGRQIVLSMHKKMVEENSLGAKVDYF